MANYEIMVIVDPKEDLANVEKLANEVFGSDFDKFTKMDKTELAYPINKSNTAQYALVFANTNGEKVKEFTRKANISKTIWRQLAINLDTERAASTWDNMKKFEEFKARKAAERAKRAEQYEKSGERPERPRRNPNYKRSSDQNEAK